MMNLLFAALAVMASVFSHPALARDHMVSQTGKEFRPAALTVKPGDTVVFRNDDTVIHNIYSKTPGFEFNFKRQFPGSENKLAFEKTGVAEIYCAIHPHMKLVLTVRN